MVEGVKTVHTVSQNIAGSMSLMKCFQDPLYMVRLNFKRAVSLNLASGKDF